MTMCSKNNNNILRLFYVFSIVASSFVVPVVNGERFFDIILGSDAPAHFSEIRVEDGFMTTLDFTGLIFSSFDESLDVDEEREPKIEVAVFLRDDDSDLPNCHWSDFGVGYPIPDGKPKICCNNVAIEQGLCTHQEFGNMALDNSKFQGFYQQFTLPVDNDYQKSIDQGALELSGPGTYVFLLGSCDDGGREIHVRGEILVDDQALKAIPERCESDAEEKEREKFLKLVQNQMKEEAEYEAQADGETEDDADADAGKKKAVQPVDNKVNIHFKTKTSAVHYAEVEIHEPNSYIDVRNLTFTSKASVEGLTYNIDGDIEVAVFRWFEDHAEVLDTPSECNWMGSGIGAFDAKGEGDICCTDAAAAKGLCPPGTVGTIIRNHDLFQGFYKRVTLPAHDGFATSLHRGKFHLEEAGTYVIMFANCFGELRSFSINGLLRTKSETIPGFNKASPQKCCIADDGTSCEDLSESFMVNVANSIREKRVNDEQFEFEGKTYNNLKDMISAKRNSSKDETFEEVQEENFLEGIEEGAEAQADIIESDDDDDYLNQNEDGDSDYSSKSEDDENSYYSGEDDNSSKSAYNSYSNEDSQADDDGYSNEDSQAGEDSYSNEDSQAGDDSYSNEDSQAREDSYSNEDSQADDDGYSNKSNEDSQADEDGYDSEDSQADDDGDDYLNQADDDDGDDYLNEADDDDGDDYLNEADDDGNGDDYLNEADDDGNGDDYLNEADDDGDDYLAEADDDDLSGDLNEHDAVDGKGDESYSSSYSSYSYSSEESDDDLDAEQDEEALNIVFGANAGAVWYSEVHIDANTAIDLSDLTFSSVSSSASGESATLDALHVEVAIFPWLEDYDDKYDLYDDASECDWMDLGVGNIAKQGDLELCCTDDAIEKGLCGIGQRGSLIRNTNHFEGYFNKLLLFPDDDYKGHVADKFYQPGVSGKYIMLVASCSDVEREVHLSGSTALDLGYFLEATTEMCDVNDEDSASIGGGYDDKRFSDIDLRFRLEPDSGIIKYAELIAISPGVVDMSDVEFWSDPEEDSVFLEDRDQEFTQMDITLIPLGESSTASQSSCDLVDLGIGAATKEGQILWCCTDDAIEHGFCNETHYGEMIFDRSILGDFTQHKVDVPLSQSSSGVMDGIIETDEAGRYLMIFSNCDTGGDVVYVTGKMAWEEDDSMNSISKMQDMEEACCEKFEADEFQGGTCGHITYDLEPASTTVHFMDVSFDREGKNDIGKVDFWLNEQEDEKLRSKSATLDVAVFRLPDSMIESSKPSACDWVDLGIGALTPDGEVYWCCDDGAIDFGLCEDSNHGRLIFNHSVYNGFHESLELSDKHSTATIRDGNIKARANTIYAAVISNCNEGRKVHVSGRLTDGEDMGSSMKFQCWRGDGDTGHYIPLVILMIATVMIGVSCSKRKMREIERRKQHQEFSTVFTDKTYPALDLVLA